ncbi:hypothetical protein OIO90_004663 [Microbotryomycetes sp. JL221]|nr:hypothetical protein OIO90_004663 [Microbotryomycetes sp. JL221]
MLSSQSVAPHLLPSKASATPPTYLQHDFKLPRRRYVGMLACQRDPLLTELVTTVIRCDQRQDATSTTTTSNKNKKSKGTDTPAQHEGPLGDWEIELEDTVLFPEGGGQPCDHGIIIPQSGQDSDTFDDKQAVQVLDVQRRSLDAIHFTSAPITVGTRVLIKLDQQRRTDLMCQHTGQHLLSAILEHEYGLDTVAWSLTKSPELCYIELPKSPTTLQLEQVQQSCNEAIQRDHQIKVKMQLAGGQDGVRLGDKVPTNYVDLTPDQGQERRPVMRTVAIEGIDDNPCCGTHYPSLSFLQCLYVSPFTTSIRATHSRIYFCVGQRVLKQLNSTQSCLRSSMNELGCSSNELLDRITTLKLTSNELNKKEKKLKEELANFVAQNLIETMKENKGIENNFLFKQEDSTNSIEFLSLIAMSIKSKLDSSLSTSLKSKHLFLLASASTPGNSQPTGGALLIVGTDSLVAAAGKLVMNKFQGRLRGGGKGRWQGKITGDRWLKGDELLLESVLTETVNSST